MKKIFLVSILIAIILLSLTTTILAIEPKDTLETNTASELMDMKNEVKTEKDEYIRKYGSESYGMTALILNKVRIYSIPLCFLAIAISAIYRFIIGARHLGNAEKGLGLMVTFVTLTIICQVLPLIFAIVVKWGKE